MYIVTNDNNIGQLWTENGDKSTLNVITSANFDSSGKVLNDVFTTKEYRFDEVVFLSEDYSICLEKTAKQHSKLLS
ncbi:MAG: hypothetical protein COB67_02380 [SAR324 cluster bacterium]|uniref:Uncharacterized protein n=1 Tax=SAR324 cluster bacterium TaxID=2024889 RepID=A0A2A4T9X4_9DELT|nr:MAG: hypothetical protein COB67_02380 [SAR324 cluster bacterium]